MKIAFTGKAFWSVGNLFIQVIVDGKVASCFITSEALSLFDCAGKNLSAEQIYQNNRDWIELAVADLIHAGAKAPIIVRSCDLRTVSSINNIGNRDPNSLEN